jgi:hypothetical protein
LCDAYYICSTFQTHTKVHQINDAEYGIVATAKNDLLLLYGANQKYCKNIMSVTTNTQSATNDDQKWSCYFVGLDESVLLYRAPVDSKPELDVMFRNFYDAGRDNYPWFEILPNTYTESQISVIRDMYPFMLKDGDERPLINKVLTHANVEEMRAFMNCDECLTLDNECFERECETGFNFTCHHTPNDESKRMSEPEPEPAPAPEPALRLLCSRIKCKGDFYIFQAKMGDIEAMFTEDGKIFGKLVEDEIQPLTEDEKDFAHASFNAKPFVDLKIFNATDLKNCESFDDIREKYGWPMTKAASSTCVESATE